MTESLPPSPTQEPAPTQTPTPTQEPTDHPPVRPVREFLVRARLPDFLEGLESLARNLAWSWSPRTVALFRRVDSAAWTRLEHSPLRLISETSAERWDELAQDAGFLAELKACHAERRQMLAEAPDLQGEFVAYFCAEFGIHESVATYSGGLGVLAGDSLKAASDQCLPLVAVGLLYHEGYFRQRIDSEGWQQEEYPRYDRGNFPGVLLSGEDGSPLRLEVPIGGRNVAYHVWRLDVGRVPLFLLDTEVEGASDDDRRVTSRLYGGGESLRLQQEVLLGVGGVRALARLGLRPTAFHMNEGHSALLTLQQSHQLAVEHSLSFEAAQRLAAACNVFTTHTPVAAGHDAFSLPLMREHLQPFADEFEVPVEDLLALGRSAGSDAEDPEGKFSMTVLGLRMSRYRNGVSRLHGEISREMWSSFWPGLGVEDVPIDHITNGVHVATWISDELRNLYRDELGEAWSEEVVLSPGRDDWSRVRSLPDGALWNLRCDRRRALIEVLRARLRQEAERRAESQEEIDRTAHVLDPEALTIGFCRRFATYKRATLLFRDMDRLRRIVEAEGRRVQFVFAGKAHPKDEPGKGFLHDIVRLSRQEEFRGKIVFVEGYDLALGRHLVQGVDVWLNTPRRPHEASGTSGMKAALNGGLNLSVMDGWWCEGYQPEHGWVFGAATLDDEAAQDATDAEALYELLEQQVVPRFYARNSAGIPEAWVHSMKETLAALSGEFSSARMMADYETRFYTLARAAEGKLGANDARLLRELMAWWDSMRGVWPDVAITKVEADFDTVLEPGEALDVAIELSASWIPIEELIVEVLAGARGEDGSILEPQSTLAEVVSSDEGGVHRLRATLRCESTGRQGMSVRVRPRRGDSELLAAPSLIRWG